MLLYEEMTRENSVKMTQGMLTLSKRVAIAVLEL